MKLPRIIALGHQACVGKDTAARWLERTYGYLPRAFASRLREVAEIVTGLPPERFTTRKKEPNPELGGLTGAAVLQRIGTAVREGLDQSVWANALARSIVAEPPAKRFAVTDLRYPEEVAALRRVAGADLRLWRVIRPDELRGDIGRPKNHSSEVALSGFDGWDAVIVNDGTFDDYYRKLEAALVKGWP